ncbi:hypothetical protein DVH05_015735 [Phytophthora capsici]|nr:hypothetical protein DVH05_015735 [Phytophthora capsici]
MAAPGTTPRPSSSYATALDVAEDPSTSPSTQPSPTSDAAPSTVQVYVCDYNDIAQLVEVPVGTTLKTLVDAAFESPTFERGSVLGFEDKLAQHRLVEETDATRWTADTPLKLKYKRDDSCLIL